MSGAFFDTLRKSGAKLTTGTLAGLCVLQIIGFYGWQQRIWQTDATPLAAMRQGTTLLSTGSAEATAMTQPAGDVVTPAPGTPVLLPGTQLFNLIAKKPAPAAPTTSAPVPLPPTTPPAITVVGVVIGPEKRLALVRAGSDPQSQSISVGQQIDGWSVEKITNDLVVFFDGSRRVGIPLNNRQDSGQHADVANQALLDKLQLRGAADTSLRKAMNAVRTARSLQRRAQRQGNPERRRPGPLPLRTPRSGSGRQ